jgi:hypothetical protein
MQTRRNPIIYALFKSFGRAVCGAIALLIISSMPVQGSVDSWTFTGILTQGLSSGPYQAGAAYSLRFVIDSTRLAPAAEGLYFPITAYYLHIGSSGVSETLTGSGVLIANNQPLDGGRSCDGIIFSTHGEQSTGFPSGTLFDGSTAGITLANTLVGPTATPFTDTSFPSTLDLGQFSERYMTYYFQGGPIKGSVDSLYINDVLQVPEPGSFSLFVASGLCLGCVLVRRRKLNTPA